MKIYNRGLLIAGEKRKVGTPTVTVVTSDSVNKVTKAYGANVPTDGDAGYATGCYFYVTTGVVGATVYINEGSSSSCDFNAVTSGAAGGISTWDALYANDKTLAITSTTVTFDGQHASNNVFTLTQTGAGSGHLLQITNVGTGKDINGTSDSWSISKTGVAVLEELTIDGTEGSNIFTVTKGDVRFLDGALAITDDDNAASFTVTNDTATTASVVVLAGSGVFTGNTTSSWMTITPSGLTTGTAVYLPLAGLTEGKGLHIVANAYTEGLILNITSSQTLATSGGRLLNIAHTGNASVSGIIAEMATAAADETILLRLTASAALTGVGAVLDVKGVGITTGNGIKMINLDALTSGLGLAIASSATAITGAGRLLSIDHTGATTSTGTIVEFKTDATDAANATTLLKLTMAAAIVGVGLSIVSTTGMTTGSLIRATTSTAGALGTNGVISFSATGNFTSTSATDGGFVEIKANDTTAGVVFNLVADALTTGLGMHLSNGSSAMTSGSLLRVTTGGTGAIATNGIVSFTHTGDFTSTSAVNGGFVEIKANDTTAGTVFNLVADALTTGIGMQLSNATSGITSGSLLRVTGSGTGTLATNGLVSITHAGIFTTTSNTGVLDVRASAMIGTLANATLVNFMSTAAAQVDTTVLNLEASGFTTGYTGTMVRIKSPATDGGTIVGVIADGITSGGTAMDISVDAMTTGIGINIANSGGAMTTGSLLRIAVAGTGAIATNGIISFTHTGDFTSTSATDGGFVEIKANDTLAGVVVNLVADALTTGVGMHISNGTAATTTGSLLRVTAGGVGAVATNGIVSFIHTGVYTSTSAQLGMFHVSASATTAGTVASISGLAVVGGTILTLNATAATLTTGRYLSAHDAAGEVFGIGANGHIHSTVGATAPTIAVTTQNGITAAAITAGGSDTCGIITTTGTNNNGGSTVLTVTFNKTYTTAPKVVFIGGANQAGQKASSTAGATLYGGAYVSSTTATTFVITIPADSAASATPSFYYLVIA